MTFSVKISGATFTKYAAQVVPHYDLLKMFLLLGTSDALSKRNFVGAKADATVMGTPSYATGYATLSTGANGFEGPMAAGDTPFTHMAVVELMSTASGSYCGQWEGSNTANLLYRNSGNLNLAVESSPRAVVAMSAAGFNFIAGSHDGTTANVYVGSAGSLTKVSATYSGTTLKSSKFRIGNNGYGSGTFKAAAVMTAEAALSDAQILAEYAYLKILLATRGVTVN